MLQTLIRITCPIFLIFALGFFLAHRKIVSRDFANELVALVFHVVIPATLFIGLVKRSWVHTVNVPFVMGYLLAALFMIGLACVLSRFIFAANWQRTVLNAVSLNHTNTGLVGLPVFLVAMGTVMPLASIMVLQSFFMVVYCLILSRLTHRGGRLPWVSLIVKNPILIAVVLGIAFNYYHIYLPALVDYTLTRISESMTFLALLALGCSLAEPVREVKSKVFEVGTLTLAKIVIHPLVAYYFGFYVLHLDRFWLKSLVLICALPAPELMFILANKYRSSIEHSKFVVMLTTVLCFVSIQAVIYWL